MSETTLHKLRVVIEGYTKPFRDEIKKAKQEAQGANKNMEEQAKQVGKGYEQTTSKVKGVTSNVDDMKGSSNQAASEARKSSQEWQNTIGLMERTLGMTKSGDIFKVMRDSVKGYIEDAQKAAGIKVANPEFAKAETGYNTTNNRLEQLRSRKVALESQGAKPVDVSEYNELSSCIEKAKTKLGELIERQNRMNDNGVETNSSRYKNLQSDIEEARNTLQEYQNDMDNLGAGNTDVDRAWRENEMAIQRASVQLRRYKTEMATLKGMGNTSSYANSAAMSNGSAIQGAVASARYAMQNMQQSAQRARAEFSRLVQAIPGVGRVAKEAAYIGSKAFKGLVATLQKIGPVIKKVSGLFSSLIHKFKSGASGAGKMGSSLRGMGKSGNSACGSLGKLGNIFKMLISRMLIMGAIRGATEGFQNLAQYSNTTNSALSQLMSSLTQLKNSFATAFAPILTVVAPILSTLINWISAALNAIGQLFAALTGQKSYVTAKKVNQDYASSLGGTSSAAKDATKAVKEYQNQIMGFDQINKRDDNKNDDSGSGGGSGGGGGLSPGDMFETVEIGSQFKDLAEKIKEAWKNADFTEIGEMVGKKLNEALRSIPWDKIQATLDKVAKSVATFLNGFIKATDWELVGETLAQCINTVFRTANTFATTFDWTELGYAIGDGINGAMNGLDWTAIQDAVNNNVKGITDTLNAALQRTDWNLLGVTFGKGVNTIIGAGYTFVTTFDWGGFGSAIASSVNGAVKTIDWSKAGKTLSDGVRGALNTLITAIQEIDWYKLGESIKDFLINIDWTGIIRDLAYAIGAALGGLVQLLAGVISDCVTGIGDYFSEKFEECGGNVILGLLKGIWDAIVGIGKWLWDNIVVPIVDGVKSMFGIHSPSTVFAEIGGFLIEGLKQGILNVVGSVAEIFKNIYEGIKNIFKNVGSWFGEKFTEAKNTISTAWSNVTGFFGGIRDGINEKFSNVKEWFGEKFTDAKTNIQTAWSTVSGFFGDVRSGINNKFSNVKDWFSEKFTGAKDKAQSAWSNTKTYFGGVWSGIQGAFGNISGWFSSVFSAAWEAVKRVFSSGGKVFDGIKDGILNGLKSVINGLISGINKVISIPFNGINSALRAIRNISILGAKPFSFISTISVPQIPKLAKGGMVDAGQLFIANEAGPELVGSYKGRSAVMNNNQIVESVSVGVYDAVMAAFTNSGGNNEAAPVIELTIIADTETLYKTNLKGEKRTGLRYSAVASV